MRSLPRVLERERINVPWVFPPYAGLTRVNMNDMLISIPFYHREAPWKRQEYPKYEEGSEDYTNNCLPLAH
jgi:hypothetical protein